MRFYVASRFRNYQAARQLMRELRISGHAITHDWTDSDLEFDEYGTLIVDPKTDLTQEQQYDLAMKDMAGAATADAVILLCDPDMCGSYIEVGIALSHGRDIYLIGEQNRWTIFWALPCVKHFKDTNTFLLYLELERLNA